MGLDWFLCRRWIIGLVCLALAGCGKSVPFDVAPVSGKVTYADGSPIQATQVRISLMPQDVPPSGKAYPAPAECVLEADGSFSELTTYQPGDGAIVGRHKVTVVALDEHESPLQAVPAKYRDPAKTPLEVKVETSGNDFQLQVEKGP